MFGFLSTDRDDRSFGRDRNRDSDKTDTDWRARPTTDSFDDYPPRRGDDSFGDSKFRFFNCFLGLFDNGTLEVGEQLIKSGFCGVFWGELF